MVDVSVLCEQGAYVDRDSKSKQYAMLVHPCDDPPRFELQPAGHDRKIVCSGHLFIAIGNMLDHDPMVVVRRIQ